MGFGGGGTFFRKFPLPSPILSYSASSIHSIGVSISSRMAARASALSASKRVTRTGWVLDARTSPSRGGIHARRPARWCRRGRGNGLSPFRPRRTWRCPGRDVDFVRVAKDAGQPGSSVMGLSCAEKEGDKPGRAIDGVVKAVPVVGKEHVAGHFTGERSADFPASWP